MKKTSVYLTDELAEALRRVSIATGRSQSELIREGVRRVTASASVGRRRFHSMGKGHGDGTPYARWNPEDIYDEVMGRR